MKKNSPTLDLKSAMRRKAEQRRTYASLPVAKKLQLMDRLHDNAAFLRSFRSRSKGKV
jgi:hypothetical protein